MNDNNIELAKVEMDSPSTSGRTFYLRLDKDWFEAGDILNDKIVIISKPRTKWYHRLLNIITFGLYKISISYRVKLKEWTINNNMLG